MKDSSVIVFKQGPKRSYCSFPTAILCFESEVRLVRKVAQREWPPDTLFFLNRREVNVWNKSSYKTITGRCGRLVNKLNFAHKLFWGNKDCIIGVQDWILFLNWFITEQLVPPCLMLAKSFLSQFYSHVQTFRFFFWVLLLLEVTNIHFTISSH